MRGIPVIEFLRFIIKIISYMITLFNKMIAVNLSIYDDTSRQETGHNWFTDITLFGRKSHKN